MNVNENKTKILEFCWPFKKLLKQENYCAA